MIQLVAVRGDQLGALARLNSVANTVVRQSVVGAAPGRLVVPALAI